MKITAVETHVCNARMRNWIFVKVLTDQPGLYGWGEATLEWHTRAVVGRDRGPRAADRRRGSDADRAPLADDVPPALLARHGIVRGTAISGIDIALWDILGKVHGVPCHRLWGGPVRDYVRLYGHLGGGKMEDFYESDEPQRFAELASAMVEQRLHRLQVDGRAADDAARRARARPPRRALRGGDAGRRRRRASTSWSTATPARARAWGTSSPRRSSRSASTGSRSRAGPSGRTTSPRSRRRSDADRHRRAARRPARLPRAAGEGRLQRPPARHHPLRRAHRGAADRRAGRGLPRRAGAPQPAGPGQHRGLDRARLRHAVPTSSARPSRPTCPGAPRSPRPRTGSIPTA